jgi:hypothetical protein
MALGTEPYRHLYAADLTALRDLSVMAERVYVHLACGERSSACCMASCDPEHLRYSVRARRTAEVLDALAELETAGWLVLDLSCKQAWLPVQAKRTWIVSDSSATGWRNDLSRFKVSVATRQALAFIDSAPVPPPKGQGSTPDLRSRNRIRNSTSIPIGIEAPAVAVDPKPKRAKTLAQDPPDLQATVDYFLEQGSTEGEAHKCHDYWLSAGWRRKSGPIKDWLATCRTWIGNSPQFAAPGRNTGKGLPPPRTIAPTDPDDIPDDDGFTPRQRREAEIQIAKMRKENDEYDAAQSAKRSQTGLFGSQR